MRRYVRSYGFEVTLLWCNDKGLCLDDRCMYIVESKLDYLERDLWAMGWSEIEALKNFGVASSQRKRK